MTRHRLLTILLLISWTLNVALGVALFYSLKQSPSELGPFPPHGIPLGGPPLPGMPMPPEAREALKAGAAPFFAEQMRLAHELYFTLIADSLDTARVMRLSDSLGEVRGRMQGVMIGRMAAMHGSLTPEDRERLYSRMVGHLGVEGHGGRRHWRHRK